MGIYLNKFQHPIPESKMAVGGGNGPRIGMSD